MMESELSVKEEEVLLPRGKRVTRHCAGASYRSSSLTRRREVVGEVSNGGGGAEALFKFGEAVGLVSDVATREFLESFPRASSGV
ncbi:hypothetical protein YC2023_108882 [Brassica napus]